LDPPRTPEIEGGILGDDAIEVLFGLVRRLAAIREKIIVAFERRDALFERCVLRVEVLDHGATVILSRVEKDASQGRRNEGVVVSWDDGQVGCH
jgi:hypothetical protein